MQKLWELPPDELDQIFSAVPFIAHLGIRLVSVGPGECETELLVQPHHLQQNGYVHAGVQAAMADHSAGGAAATLATADQMFLTAEYKINLLRPARGTRLLCKSKVLRPGSRLTVVESEVFSEHEGERVLVSKAMVSIVLVDKGIGD